MNNYEIFYLILVENSIQVLFLTAPNCSWLNLGCKIEDLNLTAFELEKQMSEKNKPKYLIKLKKQTGKYFCSGSFCISDD